MNKLLQNPADSLITREIRSVSDFETYRDRVDLLTVPGQEKSKIVCGFASSARCVDMALRLRYEVFNLELGEGLPSSLETGLDRDHFDHQMTHLVLIERATGHAIGTYRLQTMANALAHRGIYSGEEFDVTALEPLFHSLTECGRACIDKRHRSVSTLLQLWLGIGTFMNLHQQRWLFGCCSLTSTDPDDGWRALKTIRKHGYLHESILVPTRGIYSCGDPSREFDPAIGKAIPLPKLFSVYMRLGCKVVSLPAIDRGFGTVDFLILMDGSKVTMSALDVLA